MAATGILPEVRELASRLAGEMGLELVDVVVRRSGSRQMLRLAIDRAGSRGATLEDCERLSRALGTALDELDPFESSYVLEVTTPGIDRPIRSEDDVRRNTGRRVRVTFEDQEEGRRLVRGVLLGLDEGHLRLADERGDEVRIPMHGVVRAQQEVGFSRRHG